MKGDGDFLSLGSSSRSTAWSSRSGGPAEREWTSGKAGASMLSSLSRNGLSMLAGGSSNGGFSLKPPNLSGMGERKVVSGGGFTGFYSAITVPKPTSWPTSSPAEMALRFASEEPQEIEEAGTPPSRSANAGTDVESLSPSECWKLILKLGKRWPAWNKPTVPQSSDQALHYKDERNLQMGQDSLKLLASRALEALASTPGRPRPRSMLAPKLTTQEFLKTKPGSEARDPATSTSQEPVYQQSTLQISSPEIATPKTVSSAEPRTAPLTIFYAGTVNVCDNVPEDKARLIMMFAEKAGISKPIGRAPAAPSASQSSSPPGSSVLESVRPHDYLQPCSHPVLPHSEDGSSPPMPLMVTVNSRQQGQQQGQQQGPAKPLPNARKNSLARFLDSRKRDRPTASGSEGEAPSKRRVHGRSTSDGWLP